VAVSEQHLSVAGLYTDPNPLSAVPNGALRKADNVVIRRAGIVEPRPGFELLKDSENIGETYGLWSVFRDELIVADSNGALWWVDADSELTDENGNSFTAWQYFGGFVEAGKSVYFDEGSTYSGVRKIEASADSTAQFAGCPMVYGYPDQGASSGTAVAAGEVVAYRYVLGRKDANDVVVRSAPSGRYLFENAQAGAYDVTHYVFFHDSVTVDTSDAHFVEVYRSRGVASGNTPSDELYRCAYYEPTPTELGTTGYVTLTDDKADEDLGAALYTNPSREGSDQANHRPPSSAFMETFKGSLFFLYTIQPRRHRLSWFDGGSLTASDTGVGYRTQTVTLTSGNATGTLADTTGFRVGQLVDGTHFNGTDPVRVASFVANTSVTFTETANTSSAQSITFHDSIRITHTNSAEDQYYPASHGPHLIEAILHGTIELGTAMRLSPSAQVTAWATGRAGYTVDNDPSPSNPNEPRVVYLEALKRDSGAYSEFKVFATHGNEYDPALEEPTGTGLEAEPDLQPAGLYWSKAREYEHVPLSNWLSVGEGAQASYGRGLIATSNALWIFLERGLYRLTGYGARSGWRVDLVDPRLQLLAARALCTLHGVAYAWTDRGVVAVSDGGVRVISSPAINDKLEEVQREVYGGLANYALIRAFMVSNPKNDEIILGVPRATAPTSKITTLYVYNTRQGAWTTWYAGTEDGDGNFGGMCLDEETEKLVLGEYDDGPITRERQDATNPWKDAADLSHSVTVSSVSSLQVTINGGSLWTPAVGDVLLQSSVRYMVTSVDSATVFDVHTTGVSAAAATAYESFLCDVEWTTKTEGAPSGRRRYVATHLHFTDYHGVYEYAVEHTGDLSSTAASTTRQMPAYETSESQPRNERVYVQRGHGLAAHLRPRVKIQQAGALFKLAGLTVESTQMRSARGHAR